MSQDHQKNDLASKSINVSQLFFETPSMWGVPIVPMQYGVPLQHRSSISLQGFFWIEALIKNFGKKLLIFSLSSY